MKTVHLSLTVLVALVSLLLATNCSKAGRRFDTQVNVEAMIQQLQAGDEQSRVDACIALGTAGPHAASAVPALIQALQDSNALVRSVAASALGQIGPQAASAVPALRALVMSGDPDAVPVAVSALRLIDPTAVP